MTDHNDDKKKKSTTRRNALALLGVGAVGGATASSAFSELRADRPIDVEVADENNAVIRADVDDDNDELSITNQSGETIQTTVDSADSYTFDEGASSATDGATIEEDADGITISDFSDGEEVTLVFDDGDDRVTFDIDAFSDSSGFSVQLSRTLTLESIIDEALLHLDAQEIAADDEDSITTWSDLSGEGNDATNGGATYETEAIGDNPALRFTYDEDEEDEDEEDEDDPETFDLPDFMSGKSAGETLIVCRTADGTADLRKSTPFAYHSADDSEHYDWDDGNIYMTWGRDDRIDEIPEPGVRDDNILNVQSGSDHVVRYNNDEIASSTEGSVSFEDPKIGKDPGHETSWPGVIGEIVVYDKVLSESERDQEHQRLADKWGINLNQ